MNVPKGKVRDIVREINSRIMHGDGTVHYQKRPVIPTQRPAAILNLALVEQKTKNVDQAASPQSSCIRKSASNVLKKRVRFAEDVVTHVFYYLKVESDSDEEQSAAGSGLEKKCILGEEFFEEKASETSSAPPTEEPRASDSNRQTTQETQTSTSPSETYEDLDRIKKPGSIKDLIAFYEAMIRQSSCNKSRNKATV